jgi:hypothetical protein
MSKKGASYFWTEFAKELLSESYKAGGLEAASRALPQYSRGSIATQAHRMSLTTPRPRKAKRLSGP